MIIRALLRFTLPLVFAALLCSMGALLAARLLPSSVIAYVDVQSRIHILDLRVQEQFLIAPNLARQSSPAWSTDGRLAFVAIARNELTDIYIWDWHDLTQPRARGNAFSPTWSSDGLLAFVSALEGRSQIALWDQEQTAYLSTSEPASIRHGVPTDAWPSSVRWRAVNGSFTYGIARIPSQSVSR